MLRNRDGIWFTKGRQEAGELPGAAIDQLLNLRLWPYAMGFLDGMRSKERIHLTGPGGLPADVRHRHGASGE
jgi:hypothetical protein